MFRSIVIACAAALWLGSAGFASADVLLIEEVRERMQRDLPANGMSKQAVRERFGEPSERHAPVGEPPITRWVYDDYSVYFEHDLVIESVLHRGAVLARSSSDG
jgi:flavin-dependent dehydrogenase